MSRLRAKCPDCKTYTAVSIGPDHEFAGGVVDLLGQLHRPSPHEVDARELAIGVLQRDGRKIRIQPLQRLAQPPVEPHVAIVRVAALRCRLAGGNLALVCALSGTPYAIDFDGAILVVEDVSEQVYRIDRMLTHLRLTKHTAYPRRRQAEALLGPGQADVAQPSLLLETGAIVETAAVGEQAFLKPRQENDRKL